jgi:hypothetical protein
LPDIHLGPITQGKDPKVLSMLLATIENIPQLRALVFRIPLPKSIPVREKPFLGASLLFVSTASPKRGIILSGLETLQERNGL